MYTPDIYTTYIECWFGVESYYVKDKHINTHTPTIQPNVIPSLLLNFLWHFCFIIFFLPFCSWQLEHIFLYKIAMVCVLHA